MDGGTVREEEGNRDNNEHGKGAQSEEKCAWDTASQPRVAGVPSCSSRCLSRNRARGHPQSFTQYRAVRNAKLLPSGLKESRCRVGSEG